MGKESLADRLAKAAGGGQKMSSFEGEVLTVVSIEKEPSQFEKGGTAVKATVVTSEGDEVQFYTTPTGARQLIEIEEDLPQELLVVSFLGQFGKTGYKFDTPAS
jgi:hypothetical protein